MELLQVAEAVSREKNINKADVIEAITEAIQKAGRTKYGFDHDIRVEVDPKSGEITMKRYREVVANDAEIENDTAQLTVDQAQRIKPGATEGEFLIDELPPLDFGRIAAQTAKQVIMQKVREAERAKQYEEFKDKVGEIVSGRVKRIDYGNVTVDIQGKGEGIIRRDECIPRENLKMGDTVRAIIYEVREEVRGPQIFLSRSHPEFMAKLFTQEVPEIYEGTIEIKSVARDPGSRAKIAVQARDGSIDPVGACVGMRGSRVQAVVSELMGEKIDIVPFSEDIAAFTVNALQPAEVIKVILDEEKNRMEVVVPEEQLSRAIGSRGQNVRLASILLGWDIDILTEEEESQRRAEEFKQRSTLFIEALDVDEVLAHLLVAEGFTQLEEIIESSIDELNQIEGFEDEISAELQNRAKAYLQAQQDELEKKQKELGLQDDLVNFEYLTPAQIMLLAEKDIKTLDDLADLAGDELVELLGDQAMPEPRANEIIMQARAHWFAEEDTTQAEASNDEQEEPKAEAAS